VSRKKELIAKVFSQPMQRVSTNWPDGNGKTPSPLQLRFHGSSRPPPNLYHCTIRPDRPGQAFGKPDQLTAVRAPSEWLRYQSGDSADSIAALQDLADSRTLPEQSIPSL
jgi:hypothetical protein